MSYTGTADTELREMALTFHISAALDYVRRKDGRDATLREVADHTRRLAGRANYPFQELDVVSFLEEMIGRKEVKEDDGTFRLAPARQQDFKSIPYLMSERATSLNLICKHMDRKSNGE